MAIIHKIEIFILREGVPDKSASKWVKDGEYVGFQASDVLATADGHIAAHLAKGNPPESYVAMYTTGTRYIMPPFARPSDPEGKR